MLEYVIDPNKEFDGYSYHILSDGVNPYTGETKEQYIEQGFIVMDFEEFYKRLEAYHESLCGDWQEITEEQYEDALNCLPPMKWFNGGFFMSEAYTGSIYSFYQEWNGKYYTCLENVYKKRDEIIKSLTDWIANKEKAA